MLSDVGRNAVVSLRNTTANGGKCVAIAAYGYRIPDCILEAGRFKE